MQVRTFLFRREAGLSRAWEKSSHQINGQLDADVIWSFDMIEEVGSYPHNLSNSSPVISGDLIFVSTSNGQDESHVNIPSPRAPSIIAISKTTGKLVWEDNSVENRIRRGREAAQLTRSGHNGPSVNLDRSNVAYPRADLRRLTIEVARRRATYPTALSETRSAMERACPVSAVRHLP